MNLLAIVGGGKKGNSTHTLVDKVIEGARSVTPNCTVKKVNLLDHDINFCKNCLISLTSYHQKSSSYLLTFKGEFTMSDKFQMPQDAIDEILSPGYAPIEAGYKLPPEGKAMVYMRARFNNCTVKMIRWWMEDYVQGTHDYQLWHQGHVTFEWDEPWARQFEKEWQVPVLPDEIKPDMPPIDNNPYHPTTSQQHIHVPAEPYETFDQKTVY